MTPRLREEGLLQLSNIMPIKTVPCAPSVQYPLPETCSYVSKCPAGISYLRTLVYNTMHQTSAALINPQCQVLWTFHLKDIAIHDSLWHRRCILFLHLKILKLYKYEYLFTQVCFLSPLFFLLVMGGVLCRALDGKKSGLTWR